MKTWAWGTSTRMWVIRFLLAAAAVAMFGIADDRQEAAARRFAIDFDHHWPSWGMWVLTVIAAGFLAGLAIRVPVVLRYDWRLPLVIGILPALLLFRFVMVFGLKTPIIDLPLTPWMNAGPQTMAGFMIGAALAAGFRADNRTTAMPRR